MAVLSGYAIISMVGINATIVANSNACVTLSLAALFFPLDRWMDATTEHPAPTISPTPVKSISSGMQMLTAAIPSLPTPCPMNIPSMAVTADIPSIPNRVGIKYLLNKENTFIVPKSIASLFIYKTVVYTFFATKKTDKLIGFTQSSYPALFVCPPMWITKLSLVF